MSSSEAPAPRCGVGRGLLFCSGPCRHLKITDNTVKHCTMPLGTATSRHGPRIGPKGVLEETLRLVLLWVKWGKDIGSSEQAEGNSIIENLKAVFNFSDKRVLVTRETYVAFRFFSLRLHPLLVLLLAFIAHSSFPIAFFSVLLQSST